MPRGDKTGPMGAGAMTGRGEGFCAGNDVPGYMSQSFGGNFGRGRGLRRGFGGGIGRGFGRGFQGGGRYRNQFFAGGPARMYPRNFNPSVPTEEFVAASQQEELSYLKEEAQYLKGALKNIELQMSKIQQEVGNEKNVQDDTKE
ncbi:MAG: DUF5320 domain-containing protein [candidate division Zixibacteria bacterium]|nr:DUF5320 domain-containing protein [candidate division Zixibacteria bacterium]